jgi:hypothetical protein
VEPGVPLTFVEDASASVYESSSGAHVESQPSLNGREVAIMLESYDSQTEDSVESLPAVGGYQVQPTPTSSAETPDSAVSSVYDTSSPEIDTSDLQSAQPKECEANTNIEKSGDDTEDSNSGIVLSPPQDHGIGVSSKGSSFVDSTIDLSTYEEATLPRALFEAGNDEQLYTGNMGESDEFEDELRAVTVLHRSQDGSAEYQTRLSSVIDEDSATTDSSVKLNVYSQHYFGNDHRYGDAHTHVSSDGESGVNLEPSIITHASSITGDDISDAGALFFPDSFDDPVDTSKDIAASFVLLEEMLFHLGEAKPDLMEPVRVSPPARNPMTQAEALSKGSDGEPASEVRSPSLQERALVSPQAPGQTAKSSGSPSLFSDGDQSPGWGSPSLKEHVPVSSPAAMQGLPESEEARPRESPSIHPGGQQPPAHSPSRALTVKVDETSRPKYSTGTIQKLRMKKVATASRGQYVMWLTKSRTANFRKTESTPKLSWFVVSERDTEEAEETDKDAVFLLPFVSVPPWMEHDFRVVQRLAVKHPVGVPASKRLSIVIESGEDWAADEEHHHRDSSDVRRLDDEKERAFESLQKERRERLSPSQRREESDAMERLRSAITRKTNLMRRAFGKT